MVSPVMTVKPMAEFARGLAAMKRYNRVPTMKSPRPNKLPFKIHIAPPLLNFSGGTTGYFAASPNILWIMSTKSHWWVKCVHFSSGSGW
jgi:hypothetical protein